MSVTPFLFYLFAAILLFSAFRVVTASNTVHAVLYLVLAFAQGSCLWMMLGAEFLSITLILVYVGAVMVLFMRRRGVPLFDRTIVSPRAAQFKNPSQTAGLSQIERGYDGGG